MGANPVGISGHFVAFLPLRWHQLGCCPRVCRTDNSRPWNSFKYLQIPSEPLGLRRNRVLGPFYRILYVPTRYFPQVLFLIKVMKLESKYRSFPYVLYACCIFTVVVEQAVKHFFGYCKFNSGEKRKCQKHLTSWSFILSYLSSFLSHSEVWAALRPLFVSESILTAWYSLCSVAYCGFLVLHVSYSLPVAQ